MTVEIKVKIAGQRSSRRLRVAPGTTVAELLRKVGQNRETVVVRLNGRIVAEEERLRKGDLVEILPVVTGG
ncbi:MAG: sulfur carrier protein ThiS [Candidatus Hadarchaeum sp.]|uniref:sulfur carrier protein ThiS n=1 Tax=Candidatus Hadarchaeum sp. TaxID=2883567 RepID=UPI003D10BF22